MNQFSSAIVSEIVEAIGIINDEFPALYKNLDETPIWFNRNSEGISKKEYLDYAETLELNILYFERKY